MAETGVVAQRSVLATGDIEEAGSPARKRIVIAGGVAASGKITGKIIARLSVARLGHQ